MGLGANVDLLVQSSFATGFVTPSLVPKCEVRSANAWDDLGIQRAPKHNGVPVPPNKKVTHTMMRSSQDWTGTWPAEVTREGKVVATFSLRVSTLVPCSGAKSRQTECRTW